MNLNHDHAWGPRIRILSGLLFVLALALCAMLWRAPFTVHADDPTRSNLAANSGLENFDAAYGSYSGYNLRVASHWTKFLVSGTQPRFMKDGDYADLFGDCCGAITRHLEGDECQNLWLAHPFVAGIYQQMSATSGTAYTAKVMWLANVGSSVSNPDGKMVVQVGIDPAGGADATASSVIWGDSFGEDENYETIRSAARATSSTITMFVKVDNTTDVDPDWNAGWIDAVRVEQAPECTATSPASSATGTFTVQWSSTEDPLNGELTGDYDVEYKDGINGTWTRWTGKTSSTSKVFTTGQPGHTYYFRARAWASYSGTEMYGAFSPSGDTSTFVGNGVSGTVDGYAGYRLPGASVSIAGVGSATADANGYYMLTLPSPGTYSLTVSATGFVSPPPAVVNFTGGVSSVPLTVRAANDPTVNGDFENALGSEWAVSSTGGGLPVVQTGVLRSGTKSLALRQGTSSAGQSLITQTLNIVGMWQPTLSLYASLPAVSAGDSLEVGTVNGSTTLKTITGASGWTHYWVRLVDQESYFTGQLTIFFRANQAGSTPVQVYLDEVSVGKGPGGPIKSYFPLVDRND